jgi:hypothetical protein
MGGAWVFKDTRLPVSTVFDNLEDGVTIAEIMEWFRLSRDGMMLVLFDHSVPAALPSGEARDRSDAAPASRTLLVLTPGITTSRSLPPGPA